MNNEDKILNLLETMYSEFNKKFDSIDKKFDSLENNIKENRLAIVKLENNLTEKVKALYDSREVANDKLDSMDDKIDKLHLDINNLTMKVVPLPGSLSMLTDPL